MATKSKKELPNAIIAMNGSEFNSRSKSKTYSYLGKDLDIRTNNMNMIRLQIYSSIVQGQTPK